VNTHTNATTSPHPCAYIQSSSLPISTLTLNCCLKRYDSLLEKTRYGEDYSHALHHLQTRLTPDQEVLVTALKKALWLCLDALLVGYEGVC